MLALAGLHEVDSHIPRAIIVERKHKAAQRLGLVRSTCLCTYTHLLATVYQRETTTHAVNEFDLAGNHAPNVHIRSMDAREA